jgi:hypothetical protein
VFGDRRGVVVIAFSVALACLGAVAASLWRMHLVFSVPYADPEVLARELRSEETVADLASRSDRAAAVDVALPVETFEYQLLSADPENVERDVTLALLELEHDCGRWARVPRVASRIASSVGFLGGAATLRAGLLETDIAEFNSVLLQSMGVVGLGLAAALTCALIHRSALSEARRRLRAADSLVVLLTGKRRDYPAGADLEGFAESTSEYMHPLSAQVTRG